MRRIRFPNTIGLVLTVLGSLLIISAADLSTPLKYLVTDAKTDNAQKECKNIARDSLIVSQKEKDATYKLQTTFGSFYGIDGYAWMTQFGSGQGLHRR